MYTVYKTTNLVNSKFYIGVHKTDNPNDDYLGSGNLISKAVVKYGRDFFKKDILGVFETAPEAFAFEAQLVTQELVESNECYNLKLGGDGGFDYLNSTLTGESRAALNREIAKKHSENTTQTPNTNNANWKMLRKAVLNLGKNPEFRAKFYHPGNRFGANQTWSDARRQHSKDRMIGVVLVNNGLVCKQIKPGESIPEGWIKGGLPKPRKKQA